MFYLNLIKKLIIYLQFNFIKIIYVFLLKSINYKNYIYINNKFN